MNDLTRRLRVLADRLAAIDDPSELDEEIIRQWIEDFEWMVVVLYGNPNVPMPEGEIKVTE